MVAFGSQYRNTFRCRYDGDYELLAFSDSTPLSGSGTPSLSRRDLYGPAVDQILATDSGGGNVLWGLGDNQGTMRDVVDSSGALRNHVKYTSFGAPTSGTSVLAGFAFGKSGMRYNTTTGLYQTATVAYDPAAGRRLSEDPIGFSSGTTNFTAWCGNDPTGRTDASGMCGQSVYSPPSSYGSGNTGPLATSSISLAGLTPQAKLVLQGMDAYTSDLISEPHFPSSAAQGVLVSPTYYGPDMSSDIEHQDDWKYATATQATEAIRNNNAMVMLERQKIDDTFASADPSGIMTKVLASTGDLDWDKYDMACGAGIGSYCTDYRDNALANAINFAGNLVVGEFAGAVLQGLGEARIAASGGGATIGTEARIASSVEYAAPAYRAFQGEADELMYQAYASRGLTPNATAAQLRSITPAAPSGFEPYGFNPPAGTRTVPAGIPDTWRIAPTQQPGGVLYYDPVVPYKTNAVRVMPGDPLSPYPNSQAPYVRWQLNGQPLGVNGNVLPSKFTPDAHIPLRDFQFNPQLFKTP